jgi:hypothetical protein
MATQIFLNAEEDKYVEMVPKLYKQISRYTQMTPEQRQASILSDPVRRAILQTLMKNGTILSTDLEQIVFEEIGKKIDVEMILRPLVKMGIIATGWVEGLSSEVIYLTRAIFILRMISRDSVKAVKAGALPTDVAEQFLESTKRYHKDYTARLRRDLSETIWVEAEELAKYILDFEAYDIIQILREGPQQTEHLPSLLDTTKTRLRKQIKNLERANILIGVNDEEGREHLILKCNPEVVTVYPEWLISRTVDLYNEEEVPSRQAIHYLEVLKKFHPARAASAISEVE